MEKISRERFIRLGSALGVGAAVASLAACGGSGSSGDSGSSGGKQDDSGESKKAGSSAAGGEAHSGGAAIARESEVAPGSAVEFKDGGQDAVLVHLESGDFAAYSAVCTHQGCTVAYQKGQLACPCHGSVFDPANGAEVVTGPAQSPLPEIPIEVKGGQVLRA
ncbi:MAG TPA: Rieske (2Fe-2S) protein [Rubrobacter sp.]|nr:Rieske (2Fe-2S) protein [Rubrobacter sp.]